MGGAEALTGVTFGYLSAAKTPSPTANWLPLLSGTSTLTPGGYYLCWEGQSATSGTVNDKTGAFQITSVKANLTAPTGLAWQTASPYKNTTATWNWTPKDTAETALTTFSVELKKDGATVSTKTVSAAVGTTAYTCDFGDYLAASADKAGTYTFSVTAVAADSELYNSAAAVTSIDTYLIVKLTPAAGEGIASVSPSTPFALIPGGSASADITATPNSGVEFRAWSSVNGTAISDSSSATANISLSASYSGSTDIAFTACGTDSTAPVISSLGGTSGGTTLTASVSDAGTGIKEYVFAKQSEQSPIPTSGWTDCTNKAAGATVSASYTLTEGGQYYFFARDNSTTSDNVSSFGPVQTTKVIYNLGYGGNTENHYIIGSGDLTPATPARPGYKFTGWYLGDSIITILPAADYNTGNDVTITAHWVVEPVSFKTDLNSTYTATYSNSGVNLSVELNITGGSITYTWYKDANAVITETTSSKTSTYNIINVADSGKYKVVAVVDVDGTKTTVTSNIADVQISKANVIVELLSNVAYDYGTAPADITGDIVENKNYKYTLNGTDVTSSIGRTPVFKYTSDSGDYDEIGDPAGTYTIAVDSESTTSDNYSFSAFPVQKQLTVSKIPLTISGITASKQYDGTTAANNISITNAAGLIQYDIDNSKKDTIKISGTYASKNVGDSIPLTGVSLVPGDYISARYNVSCAVEELPTAGTITRRDITVTADNASKNYKAADPKTFTYQITSGSLVSGESLAGALSRGSEESVGRYDITQGTLDNTANPNYNITYVKGIFEILPNSGANKITLSGTIDKTYDGSSVSNPKYSCESDYSGTCEIKWYGSDAYQELSSKPSDAGTYYFKILAPEDGKYAACESALTQFTISKKEITVTPTANQFSVYNPDSSTDPTLTYTNTALCGSDKLSGALSRVQAGESQAAGRYKITIGTLKAVDGEGNDSSNYTITLADEYYTIKKATVTAPTPEITVSDWYYGDDKRAVTFVSFAHPEGVTPTAHYVRIENSSEVSGSETTTQPKNAGTYRVWAELSESTNYSAASGRSSYVEFTISPRPVTVTAASKTWEYDATEHTFAEYSCSYTGSTTKAAFPGNEGISSVVFDADSKITDVGTQPNTIKSVNFKNNTSASNYSITLDPGELKVTAAKLDTPTLSGWEITSPGTAEWVAVSSADTYKVYLYKNGTELTTAEATANSYNFSSVIKDQGAAASYTYKVQALNKASSNFSSSELQTYPSAALSTALVTLSAENCSVTADGKLVSSFVIFPEETIPVAATADTGCILSDTVWEITSGSGLSIRDASSYSTTVTLSAITEPANITLKANGEPAPAEITSFTAVNSSAPYSNVLFSFSAEHDVYITAWAISTKDESELVAADWTAVADTKTLSLSNISVTTAGSYHLYIKDEKETVAQSSNAVNVYSVTFANGATAATGSMSSILKVQNCQIDKLPKNAFSLQDKDFSNWKSDSNNTYADEGSYNENRNSTLTAQWVNKPCDYTVNYYVQKTDGTGYDKDSSKSFTGRYGDTVKTGDTAIQMAGTGSGKGLILNDDEKHAEKTLSDTEKSIDVYYDREEYEITYSVTNDSTYNPKTVKYLYGQTITAEDTPTKTGYTFIGWLYDNSSTPLTVMPARNVNATGYYVTDVATYSVVYYKPDINGNYSEALRFNYETVAGQTVTQNLDSVYGIIGFSAYAITLTQNNPGGTTAPTGEDIKTEQSYKMDGSSVFFNVYFRRNTYKLTLNIYSDKGKTATGRISNNIVWSKEFDVPYGTKFTKTVAESYALAYESETNPSWIKWDGYKITDFATTDWTTGWKWTTGTEEYDMPASAVEISRDCYPIDSISPSYTVEIYLETDTYDDYELAFSSVYYTEYGLDADRQGTTVSISGDGETTATHINYNDDDFKKTISNLKYYHYATGCTSNIPSGTITYSKYHGTPPETVTLKAYFKRNVTVSQISYYYYKPGTGDVLFATATESVAWGHKYNVEPAALFESGAHPIDTGTGDNDPKWGNLTYTSTDLILDKTPETYNFKSYSYGGENYYYIISFTARGVVDGITSYDDGSGTSNWRRKLTAADALDASVLTTYTHTMRQSGNSVEVYYRPVSVDTDIVYDVEYRHGYEYDTATKTGLKNYTQTPVKVTIGGIEYTVKLVNKCYVYEHGNMVIPTQYTNYPGAGVNQGYYVYNEPLTPKTGLEEVTYTSAYGVSATYCADKTNQILYVHDSADSLRLYNDAKYSYISDSGSYKAGNDAKPGYDLIYAEMLRYRNDYKDTDTKLQTNGIYAYDSEIYVVTKKTGTLYLALTYDTVYYYTLYHTINGKTCSGHLVKRGTTVTQDNGLNCTEEGFVSADGYKMIWYESGASSPATSVYMSSDKTLVGRLERTFISSMDYAYFELSESVTIGGKKTSYLTEDNIASVKADEELSKNLTETVTTQTIHLYNGAETPALEEHTVTTTTYSYKGKVAFISRTHPALSFQELALSWESNDATPIEFYRSSWDTTASNMGYEYDGQNSGNISNCYCGSNPIVFRAYYKARTHTLTVNYNYASTVTEEDSRLVQSGKTAEISAPETRTGRKFTGWQWTQTATGETWPTGLDSAGNPIDISFNMPDHDLYATAQWANAYYQQPITHYFQNTTGAYSSTLLDMLKQAATETGTVNGNLGTIYKSGSDVIGASFTQEYTETYEETKSRTYTRTFYYDGKGAGFSVNGTAATATDSELIAIEETRTVMNASSITVGYYDMTAAGVGVFSFSSADFSGKDDDGKVRTVTKTSVTDTVNAAPDTAINYFYSRPQHSVKVDVKATDGGSVDCTLAGAGTYYHGISNTISVVFKETGAFVLKGWYSNTDVQSETDDDGKLKDGWATRISPVTGFDAAEKTFVVSQAYDLVAVVEPAGITRPADLAIHGKQSYIYGYEDDADNYVAVRCTVPEGTYISAYEWYLEDTKITGATSANVHFDVGRNAGDYNYTCKVTLTRNDNGRSVTFEATVDTPYKVTVAKADIEHSSTGYSGEYDGTAHGGSVSVTVPESGCTLSYKEDGDNKQWTANAPEYTNAGTYKVYYKVTDTSGNYNNTDGSDYYTITITQKLLTLSATGNRLSRTYVSGNSSADSDQITAINSNTYEETQKYYYKINGLIGTDSCTITFNNNTGNAVYNSSHVAGASEIVFSNIALSGNGNYRLPEGYTFTVPAVITPIAINNGWTPNPASFEYDGEAHKPSVTFPTEYSGFTATVTGDHIDAGTYTAEA